VDREQADLWQQALTAEGAQRRGGDATQAREPFEYWERAFGEKVRQWRQARNWSQEDLAEELRQFGFDMHQTTLAKLEKGLRPLRVSEAAAIAAVFGLPPLAVFLAPPHEALPLPLERMQESLRFAQETLAALQQQMYDSATRFVAQQATVFEIARTLQDAALRNSRQEPEIRTPPSA
jgi:transcriptional regulator with XRE-family HTH domain